MASQNNQAIGGRKRLRNYTEEEDLAILRVIKEFDVEDRICFKGNAFWKNDCFQSHKLLKERSPSSLRERFLKQIYPKLDNYLGLFHDLPKRELQELRNKLEKGMGDDVQSQEDTIEQNTNPEYEDSSKRLELGHSSKTHSSSGNTDKGAPEEKHTDINVKKHSIYNSSVSSSDDDNNDSQSQHKRRRIISQPNSDENEIALSDAEGDAEKSRLKKVQCESPQKSWPEHNEKSMIYLSSSDEDSKSVAEDESDVILGDSKVEQEFEQDSQMPTSKSQNVKKHRSLGCKQRNISSSSSDNNDSQIEDLSHADNLSPEGKKPLELESMYSMHIDSTNRVLTENEQIVSIQGTASVHSGQVISSLKRKKTNLTKQVVIRSASRQEMAVKFTECIMSQLESEIPEARELAQTAAMLVFNKYMLRDLKERFT